MHYFGVRKAVNGFAGKPSALSVERKVVDGAVAARAQSGFLLPLPIQCPPFVFRLWNIVQAKVRTAR